MERITKKISYIEQTLSEMKKEISNIKNSNYNTNATNSLNVSNNFTNKNTLTLKTNREMLNQAKNILKLSKNYFQLTDKEKYFPKEKKLVKNMHSFNLNKKGLNIYNNIFVNSESKSNDDDKYKTIEEEENKEIVDVKNKNKSELNLIFAENEKESFNNDIKKNDNNKDNKMNNKNKDDFRKENQDLFNNYKLNNRKIFKKYFSNNILSNKIDEKTFNKTNYNNHNKYYKNSKSSLFHIEKKKIKQTYNFEYLINNKNFKNSEDISCSNEGKTNKVLNAKKNSNNNKYMPQEEFKYNYPNPNTFRNPYQIIQDENIDINNNLAYYKNKTNKTPNFQNENITKSYSQMLNILGDESINNLISKSNLFDKYGSEGFENFIHNMGYNISKNNMENMSKNLNEYKNYIYSIGKRDELGEKIKSYKSMCNKLIKMTNINVINQMIEDIDFKLRKNSNNKNMLEKIKGILNDY